MTSDRLTFTELHDGWTVEPAGGVLVPEAVRRHGPVPALVPGTVHTDLLAAGLLDDPYLGTNEKLQEWIGSTSWTYSLDFDVPAADARRHDLVFEGLDTIATVRLNGEVVLESRNQHRSYRVDATGALRPGANRLDVLFAAPVPEADRASLELEYRPHVNHHPYNAIRKMACSFGWDWGPDTATSGIWRPVRLESWSVARIVETIVSATVEGTTGTVDIRVPIENLGDTTLVVRATLGTVSEEVEVRDGDAHLMLKVADVERWWPRGYGAQNRYDLTVELLADGVVLDDRLHRVGFRSVRAEMTPDAAGTPFTIVVNDQPIFIKGVNWIPDDAFPGRVDAARYRERLTQATDANVNLIRVWGGGIFESEDFYDIADELGLLTWQDFLLACAAYAEEEPLASEIEAEAREAVVRLGKHPSLVILNGNNENIWGHEEWGWKSRLEGRTWGAGYYYDVFPRLVERFAPHVVYTPGSPFSPDRSMHPNDVSNGTTHQWELWNRLDYPRYRDEKPRFVAEFGWQGPPTWATLTEAFPEHPLTPESPSMLVHQKAMEGNVKLTDGLVAHLPLPNTMPEWNWAMGLNQAIAIRTAIEWFRSLAPHNMGTVVWQLNDCWPVVSWAAIDGYGRKKPLWYALRAAYASRLISVQPEGDALEIAVGNDTGEAWQGTLRVTRRSFEGEVLAESLIEIDVAARGAVRVPISSEIGIPSSSDSEYVAAELGEHRGLWFFAELRDSRLSAAEFTAEARRIDGGAEITVTAHSLIRELAVLADVAAPDADVDEMLVTLLPGERAIFTVRTSSEVDPERFLQPDVLRHANGLLSTSETAQRQRTRQCPKGGDIRMDLSILDDHVSAMTWGWTGDRGTWATAEAERSLDAMKPLNLNWVTLAFAALQDTVVSTEIPWREEPTPTDDEVRWAIRAVHDRGWKAILKPTVNCRDGLWRGYIGFFDWDVPGEAHWGDWFASYTEYIVHFAQLAQEEGAEMFCIGCEMVRADPREAEWRELVAAVRAVYSGIVTYNCDKYQEDHVTWWDAVDVISASGYYPTGEWEAQLDRIAPVVERHDKPFLFIEAGCPSRDTSPQRPNDWTLAGEPSGEAQAAYLSEMFEACRGREWVGGFALWDWPVSLYSAEEAATNTDYCMYAKPGEQVVAEYYASRAG